ncbi:MAG: TatD family hydrolase [Verrucomicrobia bacterium]|nr:TatD family hydrolase [Verrucomicrobiota bacterium]
MSLRFYDAHNHLQDERFGGCQAKLLLACAREGVACMVVNGSCEADWPRVIELARQFPVTRPAAYRSTHPVAPTFQSARAPVEKPALPPSPAVEELKPRALDREMLSPSDGVQECSSPQILPSFGYHPWYIHECTGDWLKHLNSCLDQVRSAVGEIGLDRWKPGLAYEGQEEMFVAQLRLAAHRNLPVSIHCLQAWGRMLEILKREPRPACGFLLHSYGGPKEMVKPFADLGAYFSLPGYYAHERKQRQRETFKHVPPDRLLIETDAPDQSLPRERNRFLMIEAATDRELNHPANLPAVYQFAAELFAEPLEALAARVEANFLRLFGGLM